jgi:hypothetical protein
MNSLAKKTLGLVFMTAAAATTLTGCGGGNSAKQAVENLGFTEVDISYSLFTTSFRCSDSDDFGYNFTAKNTQGKVVSGYVCNGFLKGSTVRF